VASDQEIAAYYNANKAAYAAKETRNITQVVAQDRATANAIAARAKGGATLAAAAAPAGASAALSTQNDQTRDAYAGVAGDEAAAAAKLPVTTTPLIIANGTSRTDPTYKLPPELAPTLKAGFEIAPNDPPEVITLPNDGGSAVVSPAQVVASAPAPLASIRDQVANDWITQQAMNKARDVANQLAAKASGGMSLADAVNEAGITIPPVRPISARRIQIASAQNGVPPAMRLLFTLGQGK